MLRVDPAACRRAPRTRRGPRPFVLPAQRGAEEVNACHALTPQLVEGRLETEET